MLSSYSFLPSCLFGMVQLLFQILLMYLHSLLLQSKFIVNVLRNNSSTLITVREDVFQCLLPLSLVVMCKHCRFFFFSLLSFQTGFALGFSFSLLLLLPSWLSIKIKPQPVGMKTATLQNNSVCIMQSIKQHRT